MILATTVKKQTYNHTKNQKISNCWRFHSIVVSSVGCQWHYHGLINYKDTKAKCRHLKKLPVKGQAAGVWGLLPLLWPHTTTTTPYTMYTYVYSEYLFTQGRGGRRWTSEKVKGATVHKAGSKIPTWLTVSPVYKLWQTPAAKSLLQANFLWRHFALVSI